MVSLVVPMYCCEDCVDSILEQLCNQDYKNIEILCVVDGSPDRTLELLEKYAKKDKRIRILMQEHKGAGAARNMGLAEASGKYVMFPDADDKYAPNYVSRLVRAVEENKADAAICRFTERDAQLRTSISYRGNPLVLCTGEKVTDAKSVKKLLQFTIPIPHNKIFRKALITDSKLAFSETVTLNDCFFVNAALISANRVVYVNEHLLTHTTHGSSGSISMMRAEHPDDVLLVTRQLYCWLKEKGRAEQYRREFVNLWSANIHLYASYCEGDEFIGKVVHELICEEPWKSMKDDALQKGTRLQCANSKKILEKQKRQLEKASSSEERNAIILRITMLEREINNCGEIKRCLEAEHGKKLDANETMMTYRLSQIRDAGLWISVQLAVRKICTKLSKDKYSSS